MTSFPERQKPPEHQKSDDAAKPESASTEVPEPIGQLLKRAGLLSDAQIQLALMDQGHHNLMFGEILVMRGWLKPQTLRFFLDTFRRAQEASQHQPLTAPMPQMASPSPPSVDLVDTDFVDTDLADSPQPPANPPKHPAPVPTLSAELSGLGDPVDEFEPLEVSTTTPEDLSKYLTSSPHTSRIPKPKRPPHPTNRPKTNSLKIGGFALEAEEESLDLSFEEGLSEAELRAMLDLD